MHFIALRPSVVVPPHSSRNRLDLNHDRFHTTVSLRVKSIAPEDVVSHHLVDLPMSTINDITKSLEQITIPSDHDRARPVGTPLRRLPTLSGPPSVPTPDRPPTALLLFCTLVKPLRVIRLQTGNGSNRPSPHAMASSNTLF